MIGRRKFLKLMAVAGGALFVPWSGRAGALVEAHGRSLLDVIPASPPAMPWLDALPLPEIGRAHV